MWSSNMFATVKHILSKPYSHYVIFFSTGVGLELFMNFFQVGEVSIYRSIKKNISSSRAQEEFELERELFEKIQLSGDVEI